jgi:hypothetical protein
MSLASAWAGIEAGCVSIPQHGYFATEPDAKYQLTYAYGVNRSFWRFQDDVRLVFNCPSPPHTFRCYFHEKPPGESNTDPILSIEGYLAACGSPGTYLGTSLWFTMAFMTIKFAGGLTISPNWIHLMNYKTNSGSIGLKYPFATP